MKKNIIISLLLISLLSISSCKEKKQSTKKTKFNLPVTEINITNSNNTTFTVKAEIARKPEERNFGYMEREEIPEGTGMIFVFENDQMLSFWMKNTPHPLSIAYIDSTGTIADIFDLKPYSLDPVKSTRSVRYALEVPQGWYKANDIKKGDTVDISFFK